MSEHIRTHWRTLALAMILVLSGVARCSVPRMVMAPMPDTQTDSRSMVATQAGAS